MIQSLEAAIRIEGLVSRAQNGDREAFALLYQEYFKKIYRYTYLRLGQVEQAEDLTQEVFLKALDGISSYRHKGAPFGSWLFRIAHNLIVDHYRKSKKEFILFPESTVSDGADDPAGAAEKKMELLEIKHAVGMLPPRQKEIIALRYGAGMSVAETARATGKTVGSVKKLQFEALAKLRRLIGNGQEK
ncbi:MAG: sigma-70 family RNA polymerase sigma factor [Chloroflexi bacterium]|nr:sigma-70 family RNA polymerase sigma factor [Chloroflexota bacterium]